MSLILDNGTEYKSEEVVTSWLGMAYYNVKTAPQHPSPNGLAERSVDIFKRGMT